MIFDHSRFEIWNALQHPYKHNLSDFGYSNGALPGVSNVESALNYMVQVLYPVYVGTEPTPGDLPTGTDTPNAGDVTPTIGDYRVVTDDGDGKQAGYRWEQREGDVSPKWYKIFDVDWSTDGILAQLMDITQDVYVFQQGKSDLDENGDPITGTFAGQRIWGGDTTGQHLTLDANSVDDTGFVQVNSNFRPTVDDTWALGESDKRFTNGFFSNSLVVNTMTLATGSITDTTGTIDFGDENLVTTGTITGSFIGAETFLELTEIATPANPVAGKNRLYFKSDDLLYRLDSDGNELLVGLTFTSSNDNRLIKSDGTGGTAIQESGILISDTDEMTGLTRLVVDSLQFDGDVISNPTGNINLTPNLKVITGTMRTPGLTNDKIFVPRTDGTYTATGIDISATNVITGAAQIDVDNLRIDGNTFSSTSGDLNLSSNSGTIGVAGVFTPDADNTRDLGTSGARFANIFLSDAIGDGTNEIIMSDLLALRSTVYRDLARTQPAVTGDALFYDSVNNVWLASVPNSEISHPNLSNLTSGDSGHTQFAMLAGRAGGQTIQGGTVASENLTLESTADATKGSILFADDVAPSADATFSGGWNGVDLGADAGRFANAYMRGEFFGLRLENVSSNPSSGANNVGRAIYNTTDGNLYVDNGTTFEAIGGGNKFVSDVSFDGIVITKDVNVSAAVADARNCIIQLLDNSNDFERIVATIKATSAINVRIETNVPLPAGSYRLIAME